MFRDRKPIGPIRRRLLYDDSEDSDQSTEEKLDELTAEVNGSKKNVHNMVENWKQSINSDEAQRRMIENYVRSYIDISDEEMEEVLSQHGL